MLPTRTTEVILLSTHATFSTESKPFRRLTLRSGHSSSKSARHDAHSSSLSRVFETAGLARFGAGSGAVGVAFNVASDAPRLGRCRPEQHHIGHQVPSTRRVRGLLTQDALFAGEIHLGACLPFFPLNIWSVRPVPGKLLISVKDIVNSRLKHCWLVWSGVHLAPHSSHVGRASQGELHSVQPTRGCKNGGAREGECLAARGSPLLPELGRSQSRRSGLLFRGIKLVKQADDRSPNNKGTGQTQCIRSTVNVGVRV
jgi:hypothetical protein